MASSSFGGSVKLKGESEYRKALKDITTNLRLVSSELKLTNTEFNNGDKSIKQTKSSYDNMSKALEEQKTKVSTLRQALLEAEKEYGSNNERVKTFKTQLNNAERQLKSMESQTDKSTKELKDMKGGFDDAGKGALSFGDILKANVLSDVIVGGMKKLGSAVLEVGKALINVGKQAIQSYADYEQLIGGVETLFKESSGIVQGYANNAYKTAGLSANEYMQTVTSFSASLLQSLNGDTAKSAKVADMAISDMSDNANKMGTDMSMIQNAYQGFAKQNYTMLDNLKLGYGGTKTEMERLLKDAQKISGVKYDISNLNDVYEAIHVIQNEMGITGTTAKEASETISGSIASMKSSWQNLLTGIADDNANFGELVNNFVESLIGAYVNLQPRIVTAVTGLINLVITSASDLFPNILQMAGEIFTSIVRTIQENLPQLLASAGEMINTLVTGISNTLPQLIPMAIEIIKTLINTLLSNLPQILEMGITMLNELVKGIADTLPELIPTIIDAVILIVETLIDNIDLIIDAGIQLILGLADGLIEALPRLIEKAPEIIQKLYDAVIRNFPKIVQAGGELIGKLVMGLTGSVYKLFEVAPQLIANVVNGIKGCWEEIKNSGKYLIEGLWEGISGMTSWLKDKVTSFANNIVKNIKNALGIHSPSTMLRDEVGKFMAQGIGVGFSDEMEDVAQNMKDAIPTKFDTSMQVNSSSNLTGSFNNINLVQTFKEALKEMKIELNDREIGNFVDTKIAEVVC